MGTFQYTISRRKQLRKPCTPRPIPLKYLSCLLNCILFHFLIFLYQWPRNCPCNFLFQSLPPLISSFFPQVQDSLFGSTSTILYNQMQHLDLTEHFSFFLLPLLIMGWKQVYSLSPYVHCLVLSFLPHKFHKNRGGVEIVSEDSVSNKLLLFGIF